MMHNDGMSQLDLLVKRFSPPLLEVSQDSAEEPKLAPGERVQAHVLASMPNGRFQVLVKNQVLDMNLPSNTQPGEQLDLSVVKNQPRLTFAFTSDLQRALPQLAPEVKLSDAVKYLGALLNRVDEGASKAATLKVQTPPLLTAEPTDVDTAKLAQTLQKNLSQSGVFFESHQAEWVTGQRSLSDLMQEPQARMGTSASPAIPRQPLASPDVEQQVEPELRTSNLPRESAVSPHSTSSNVNDITNAKAAVNSGLKPELQPLSVSEHASRTIAPAEQSQLRELVQQQLNLLDTRQITWMGLAWPGQSLEWVVQERQGDQAAGESEQAVWYSRLKLDLPNLGEVVAAVSLQAGGLQIHFQARADTAGLLQTQKPRLQGQLAAAGLNLLGATINDEPKRS